MALTDVVLTNPQVRSGISQGGLKDRVRGDIGLRGQNFLADTDLVNWANEASDIIAVETRWYTTSMLMTPQAGQAEYTFPADGNGKWISILEMYHNQLPLYLVTKSELYVYNPYWRRTADGTPLFYYPLSSGGFGLHPTPGTTITNGLFIVGTALPPHPAGDTDYYYVPFGGEKAIVTYAKMMAADKDIAGEGRFRYQDLRAKWLSELDWIKKVAEAAAEGDHATLGSDAEGDGGVYRRVWGFDPNTPISAPSG